MLLKVGELAKRTGLTVRTLHHYDAIGLLNPSAHSETGYRLYNRHDVKRLYHILALIRLGLSLSRIGTLLAGADPDISNIIEQQVNALNEQIARGGQLRDRLLRLREQLERDDEPALIDCLQTLELMTMYDKYFSPEELTKLRERGQINSVATERIESEWPDLIEAVRQQMETKASPGSPEVQVLCRRWQQLVRSFAGNDTNVVRKLVSMYQQEGSLEAHTGIDSAMLEFMRLAIAAGESQQASAQARTVPSFHGNALEHFEAEYRRQAPWDIGRPQQALQTYLETHAFEGPILDVGCGSGDLSLLLAKDGHVVTGIDFSESAIAFANQKAALQECTVDFRCSDAFDLPSMEMRFNTVLDCGFLHCLSHRDQVRFASLLKDVIAPGGQYIALGFAIDIALPGAPAALKEAELRAVFADGWEFHAVETTRFETKWAKEGVPAIMVCLHRAAA
jgi:DNA-binding transcriptional MerR regulator/2-polyprenyl-3-methyl-5-hydroxy-6-metoxy-1,4-benzoquinol methylase